MCPPCVIADQRGGPDADVGPRSRRLAVADVPLPQRQGHGGSTGVLQALGSEVSGLMFGKARDSFATTNESLERL